MKDNRDFDITFRGAYTAMDRIYTGADQVKNSANAITALLDGIDGSDALRSVRGTIAAIRDELLNEAERAKKGAEAGNDCLFAYASAEAAIMGTKVDKHQFQSNPEATPVPAEETKQEQQPAKENAKEKDKGKDEKPTSGWFKDIYVIVGDTVIHYDRAYINSSGKITAYEGMTRSSYSALDFDLPEWDEKSKNINNKGYWSDRKVYKQGEGWLTKDQVENEKEGFSKRTGQLAAIDLFSMSGEYAYFGFQYSTQTSGDVGYADFSVSAKYLDAEYHVNVGAGVYMVVDKDGKYHTAYGVDATVGGSVSFAEYSAEASASFFDDGMLGVQAQGEVKELTANAQASAGIQWVDGKGPEIAATVNAGAYLGTAGGSAGVSVAGIEANVGAQVSVGVGVDGAIGFSDGKFRCEIGIAVGIGIKISFDIDISKFTGLVIDGCKAVWKGIKIAAEAIADAAEAVYDFAGDAIDKVADVAGDVIDGVGDVLNDVGDAIEDFFSGW